MAYYYLLFIILKVWIYFFQCFMLVWNMVHNINLYLQILCFLHLQTFYFIEKNRIIVRINSLFFLPSLLATCITYYSNQFVFLVACFPYPKLPLHLSQHRPLLVYFPLATLANPSLIFPNLEMTSKSHPTLESSLSSLRIILSEIDSILHSIYKTIPSHALSHRNQ